MVKNVKSKNQKGGITAGTVNIGNAGDIGAKQQPKRSIHWLVAAAAVATIVAAAIAAIMYFDTLTGAGEKTMADDKKTVFNVTSKNQSGGITAGQVNIGPQPRVLGDQAKSTLLRIIAERNGAPITVTAVMGDGEAFQLAEQVKSFLESEGHQIMGVNQAVYTKPVMGQLVEGGPDKVDIIIGTRQ